jgi:hypothetical protein
MMDTRRKLTILALTFAGACGTSVPPLGGSNLTSTTPMARDTCVDYGFRQSTPSSVVCPGAPSCLCSGADACCLLAVDSSKGVCEAAGKCRAFLVRCDGPEDCNPMASIDDGGVSSTPPKPAEVCCLDESVGATGGGTACRTAGTCPGKVLCRTDEDCAAAVPNLPRCRPADYGTPGVEDRGLDGLIGYCAR